MAKGKKNNTTTIALVMVVIIIIVAGLLLYSSNHQITAPVGSSCVGQSPYACSSYSYSRSDGNLTVTLKQNTGSNWSVTTIAFVPRGTAYNNGIPSISWANGTTINGGLQNGIATTARVPVSGPVAFGVGISGTLWAQYQTNVGGTINYVQLAVINTTAV
jgi:hypothetical protein